VINDNVFLIIHLYCTPLYKRTGEKQDARPILEVDRTGEIFFGVFRTGENFFRVKHWEKTGRATPKYRPSFYTGGGVIQVDGYDIKWKTFFLEHFLIYLLYNVYQNNLCDFDRLRVQPQCLLLFSPQCKAGKLCANKNSTLPTIGPTDYSTCFCAHFRL